MSKKFTEEQYLEIVDFSDIDGFETIYEKGLDSNLTGKIIKYIQVNGLQEEAMALANPATRELAYDKYVEEEKKYYWASKKEDELGNVLTLYKDDVGMVSTDYRKKGDGGVHNENEEIMTSEIREWGYNPDMFERTEVK